MLRFVLMRVGHAAVVLVLVATVVFFLDRVTGNPVQVLLPPDATAADAQQLSQALGLNQPLILQYLHFMGGLAHLNLGQSLYYRSDVLSIILQRLPATAELAAGALVFALVLAVPSSGARWPTPC
jgi:peptide/nickel transport system permease protein